MLTFLSSIFVIGVLIISIITFSVAGIDGMSSQIQIEFFTSIHQLTFASAFLLFVFMGWVCIMTIGILVASINAYIQKSYLSLIIGFLIIIPPILIIKFDYLPLTIRKFLKIQPINGVDLFAFIDSLFSYNIFAYRVLTSTAIIIFAIVCSIICILLSPLTFTYRINRS